jgi:anti-sigma-V factor rsiV
MNKQDRKIRRLLKKERIVMPESIAQRFDFTVAWLQKNTERKPHFFTIGIRTTAVLLLLAFFILPNVSPEIAYAMQEIPVVDKIVRVITTYDFEKEDENHSESIRIPHMEAEDGMQEPLDVINEEVKKMTDEIIARFRESAEELPDSHFDLLIDYETITNNENWFTLKIIITESAGTGSNAYRYYHIDKSRGEIVTLADIFDPDFDYVHIFSENIKQQMAQQMETDPDVIYWMYSDDKTFWGFYEIAPDQNFYFNQDGDLVIVFDKYEVAPGTMGYPEFVIPRTLYTGDL